MAIPAQKSLALLRVAVGCLFLIFAEYKVFGSQFTLHGGFQYWINQFIAGGSYPFMVPVLRGLVLPHAMLIAFLVAYGELAIGISLVLGVLVRRQRLRIHLHDGAAVLCQLSRPACGLLAILRRVTRSFGAGPVLRGLRDHPERRTLEILDMAARGKKN